MEGLGLSKTIYDKTLGFLRVSLSEAEQDELSRKVRALLVRNMEECIDDARAVVLKKFGPTTPSNIMRVANALFERRAPAGFSIWQEALSRKVHDLKNGKNGNGD